MWLLLSALAFAQDVEAAAPIEEAGRPTVGLALSGGGALGLAHVGVLQAMEELRIPVDCVAGTSIGGLIGGLYASGMSADEIAEVIQGQDWGRVFVDKPDRDDLSMRRKQDDFRFVSSLTVGVGAEGVQLPLGLREGHRQNLLFESLTLPVVDVHDFDALPIPYRAIAARLDTQAEVELASGELAQAMRATMSIPGAFAPVEVDGVLLVDGGVADNLPVDNVRGMGADVVIASWVDLPSGSKDMVSATSATMFSLLDRGSLGAIDTLGVSDTLVTLSPGDALKGGWTKGEALIQFGYDAARVQLAHRKDLQLSEADYAAWRAATKSPPQPTPTIHFIRLDNQSRYSDATLLRMLEGHEGQPFDGEAIIRDVDRIYGLGAMSWVSWSLAEEGGQAGLLIEVREKPWGPNYLSFGVNVEAGSNAPAALGLTLAHRTLPWNRLGGEWANELTVGRLAALRTELYQPLGPGMRPFVAAGAGVERLTPMADIAVWEDAEIAELYRNLVFSEAGAYVDLGVMPTANLELRVGYHVNMVFVRSIAGMTREYERLPPALDFSYGQLRFRLRHDRLDDAWFPRRGTTADVTFDTLRREFYAGESYRLAAYSTISELGWWFSPGKGAERHTGSLFLLSANIWPYYDSTGLVPHSLGGLFRYSGYPKDSILEDAFVFGRLGYRFQALKGPLPLYIGGTLEAAQFGGETLWVSGELWLDRAASVYVGIPTPLGPVYLAWAVNDERYGTPVLVIGQVL